MTPYSNKLEILADLWMNYRDDSEFEDFLDYNDLGLPLSFLLANSIVKETKESTELIEETFMLLLAALDIEKDEGYQNLDDLLNSEIF